MIFNFLPFSINCQFLNIPLLPFMKPYFLILLIALTSCSTKTFNTTEELWEYVKDPENQYVQKKNINGIDFSLLYKPNDLLVDQELGDKTDDSLVVKYRNKYKDYMYFTLSMSKNNHELLSHMARDRQKFGAMVNELAFGMNQKVHVYTPAKDTLPMTDFVYPRMYGMSGSTSILFVYPRKEENLKEDYLNFTIQDLGFYTGEVKFKVPTDIINNEPKLKFE